MGYIGMCGPKGYGFSAGLVIKRVSVLATAVIFIDFSHFAAILATNRVSGHKKGIYVWSLYKIGQK